jgi:hypothetical protein
VSALRGQIANPSYRLKHENKRQDRNMGDLFQHSEFLLIAAALISIPIIIHLINRMRFKRIKWAAMEFLLKAQKRTRRRLIIEQLLLLALRCFLIALVGFLVSRFIGCGDSNFGGKPNLHVVLLDDTPSMQDTFKHDGSDKTAFDVARTDVLHNRLAKELLASKTNDQVILLPLSKLNDPNFDVKEFTYEKLNDPEKNKKFKQDITELQPSMVHVPMVQGVKEAAKLISGAPTKVVTVHVISDYRSKDWSLPASEALNKELLDLVKGKKGEVKVFTIDTAYPPRTGNHQKSPDNIGIVEFKPSTRIIGKNMPVQFTVVIKNFSGKLIEATLTPRDEMTGKDLLGIDFNPQNPIKLTPGAETVVTFEHRFNPDARGLPFQCLSVRLGNAQRGRLENDALPVDNIRHAVVEVRDKVPVLIVDGAGSKGREEAKDSFHVREGLLSVPGASFQVDFADELARGETTKVLERADLHKYPSIFLLNVPSLKPKELANLEAYVRDGGGVAFFLGNRVEAEYYNRHLYKEGGGIFPAPIKSNFFPPLPEKELEPKGDDAFQLIVRDEKFGGLDIDKRSRTPIFGALFEDPRQRTFLRDLPIRRYWQVNRGLWKQEIDDKSEIATLPNDSMASKFDLTVAEIVKGRTGKAVLENPEFAKYRAKLRDYFQKMEDVVRNPESKAFALATVVDNLLNDQGAAQPELKEANPNMTMLWDNSDPNVRSLRKALEDLREEVRYGDPFVVTKNYHKGKVVAVMSTAGKDWNDWAGGSAASILYAPFIWELQNYLSSSGADANLTLGTDLEFSVAAEQFKGARLKLVRNYRKPEPGAPYTEVKHGEDFGREVDGKIHFTLTKHNLPGVYVSELFDDNGGGKALASLAHAFNIDTAREGDLQRISEDDKKANIITPAEGAVKDAPINAPNVNLVNKINDWSESPWLFLLFLLVLVAEQALAVHLSFHMKTDDQDLKPAGIKTEV